VTVVCMDSARIPRPARPPHRCVPTGTPSPVDRRPRCAPSKRLFVFSADSGSLWAREHRQEGLDVRGTGIEYLV
jgi:hypothetical protein